MVNHTRLSTGARTSAVVVALGFGLALGSADTAPADGLALPLPIPIPAPPVPHLSLPIPSFLPLPLPSLPAAPDIAASQNEGVDLGHGSGYRTLNGTGSFGGGTQSRSPYPGQMAAYDTPAAPAASAGAIGAKVGNGLVAAPLDLGPGPILPLLVAAGLLGLCGLLPSARRFWTRAHLLRFSPE